MKAIGCILLLIWISSSAAAEGILRVHPQNRMYFTDDSGRAIYLSGHQWFNDLQHHGWGQSVDVNWERYLDFMQVHRLNYLRNWIIWSVGESPDSPSAEMPFKRTGPGQAVDGAPKFDLEQFDDAFFARLANQVDLAGKRGVYMSIMLFEVYGFLGKTHKSEGYWIRNVFHGPNNINGIDVDAAGSGQGMEFFFTENPRVREIQKRYVRKMVETLNPYDHVIFEIANELEAPEWQLDMLRTIRDIEAALPKQHLVYLSPGGRVRSGKWKSLPKAFYLESDADVIAVSRNWDKRYLGDPPVSDANRPVFMDMDHVAATLNEGDNEWNNSPLTPWKALTRGYHICIYDSDYWKPGKRADAWAATRRSCGAVAALANRLDLASMRPRNELASTGYCLAKPGREYLVLQTDAQAMTVRELVVGTVYSVEWFSVTSPEKLSHQIWTADDASGIFRPPASGAVLHIRATE